MCHSRRRFGDPHAAMDESMPKSLIPVCGRPFTGHQLDAPGRARTNGRAFSLGYRGAMIRSYVGDGSRWGGIRVDYVDEGADQRHAGALRLALDTGKLDQEFFVLYGDSYLTADMTTVETAYRDGQRPALMTVFRNDGSWGASNVVCGDGTVIQYDKWADPRPAGMVYIDYGLSILNCDLVALHVLPDTESDLAYFFGDLAADHLISAYEVRERFYEIGSPEGLADLERHLSPGGSALPAGDNARQPPGTANFWCA